MTSVNPLLELWRAGKPSLGGWLTTADPQIAEYLASVGFDEICVDQQHGLADSSRLASMFRALELHGVAPTTRVPGNDFAAIGKALDVGAVAIIVPMVGSPEEAAAAADACHYPPRGHRSVGPLRGPFVRASDRLDALDEAACVVMIETAEGVRNADAIAATPGVDAIYIGPGDLALGLGLSAWSEDWSPNEASVHAEAVGRIVAACRNHGVAPGIHTGDGETARRYLDQGFLMVTVANELGLITVGGRAHLAVARGAPASALAGAPTADSWSVNRAGARQVEDGMTVGFGLIGAGQMAHIHAVAIHEQEEGRARLVAVAGGTRAPALAAEFGAEAVDSVEALLDRGDIDAVVIATPHTAHLPNVVAAAAAGKHILLEKPMALDVAECRRMIDACAAAGVHLSLAKISRWLEAVKVGRDLVADGVAGDLVAIHVHRLFPGYPNTGWPLDPREGGAWLDWGSHGCDIVRWYAGREPELVIARFASRRTDMPDLTGMATYQFPGALLANLFMSYEIPGAAATERAHYTAIGTESVIDVHAYGAVDVLRGDRREAVHRDERFSDANTTWDEHAPYFRRGFAAQVRDLVESVETGRPPTIGGEDGLAAVAMATGALRSWREDVVVRL